VASFIVSKLGDFVASNDSLSVGFNFVKGVSIEDFDVSQEIQVYPNPFVDGLTLNSSLPIAEISILDLSGKIVHNQVVNDQKLFHLYVPIAAGMYTLEAKTSGGIYRTSIVKIDE
ncbi:MAG: Secretion system C-terminal sorting domain, partial [Bacteroidota bacterium]|jgi:hypothetical protein